jgi:hypothetical protein
MWESGLIIYLLAFAGLAVAVSWGRSGMGPYACFLGRYSLLSMPVLAAVYLVAGESLSSRLGTIVQFGLAAVLVACLPVNYEQGLRDARLGSLLGSRFLADVEAGKPLAYVLHRNQWLIPSWDGPAYNSEAYLHADTGLRLLHQEGVPNFANLRVDLPPSEMIIVYRPDAKQTVASRRGQEGPGSFSIDLERPQKVRAILALCTGPVPPPVAIHVDFSWRKTSADRASSRDRSASDGGQDWVDIDGTIYNCVAATWIDETIDRFRIECRSPGGPVRIRKVGLLIAADVTPPQLQVDNLFFRFRQERPW